MLIPPTSPRMTFKIITLRYAINSGFYCNLFTLETQRRQYRAKREASDTGLALVAHDLSFYCIKTVFAHESPICECDMNWDTIYLWGNVCNYLNVSLKRGNRCNNALFIYFLNTKGPKYLTFFSWKMKVWLDHSNEKAELTRCPWLRFTDHVKEEKRKIRYRNQNVCRCRKKQGIGFIYLKIYTEVM